jgi:carbamoyltransferase
MWLLGINIGHNGATALYKDSELIFYIEEDRLSGMKYDGNPYMGMEKAFEYTDHIDFLVLCGTRNAFGKMPWTGEDPYTCYVRKKQGNYNRTKRLKGATVDEIRQEMTTIQLGDDHHLTHAATAFYNSGFDDAVAIVIDGAGSGINVPDLEYLKGESWEVESIWTIDYPAEVTCKLINYGTNLVDSFNSTLPDGTILEMSDGHGITKSYEAVTQYLGFHAIEAGKTMGIASYGKPNDSIKIDDGMFNNRSFIKPKFPAGSLIRSDLHPELKDHDGDTAWQTDPDSIDDYRKDLAYAVQKSAERRVANLIRRAIEITGRKKVVMAGGFILNCVANYEFLKEFPDVEFYHEPVAHDGGNVMGACQFAYRKITGDGVKAPLTSLYLGPDKSVNYDVDFTGFDVADATAADVAKLIADENIVCLYQGRSEAGPRALGNRSILFDPTVINGKDIVNEVKHREWFRPFAGSVMAEHASEWFDFRSRKDSPFMMYAVNVLEDKKDLIPAITHVDGTCRIQTVTSEQNPHYYELISEFNKIKNVPMLFNTSFNLAGDPLVETVKHALETLLRSEMKYLWLPEIGKLLTKSEFNEV